MKTPNSAFLLPMLFVAFVLSFSPATTNAQLVTFNGGAPEGDFQQILIGETFSEGFFQLEVLNGEAFIVDNNFTGQLNPADDDVLFLQNEATVVFTHTDGLNFGVDNTVTIGSFDGFGSLEFTGILANGGTVTFDAPVATDALTSVDFDGFNNLSSLAVTQTLANGNFLSLDQIQFTAVPEPGSIVILSALGMGLLTHRRRRK